MIDLMLLVMISLLALLILLACIASISDWITGHRKEKKQREMYRLAISSRFPDAKNGYRIIYGNGTVDYIIVNNKAYAVVFSNDEPYSIVFSKQLQDKELDAVISGENEVKSE